MNKIDVQYLKTVYDYPEYYLMIDNKVITQYIDELAKETKRDTFSYLGLMPAWTGELGCKTENTFIWEMLDSNESNINIPILVCEDDCDLSCTVVMVKIRRTNNFVYWDKLGFLKKEKYDNESYNKSGIMNLLSYTDDDWEKYGSNIALAEYGSHEYWEWVSDNWEEEKTRRLKNYLYPFMQNNENIDWIGAVNWEFNIQQYDEVIEKFRKFYKAHISKQ